MGGQGSLMHVGSKGWPLWSEILQLLRRLMLVLVESCQNTQCIEACCIRGYIAAEQSGCPCWALSTAKSANNGHMIIRTGPRSNGRWWPGMMNNVFFYITWMAGRCLPGEHMAPECTMGRRQAGGGSVMLWAMLCWETLGPAIHMDVSLKLTTHLYTLSWKRNSLMAVTSFSRIMCRATKQKLLQVWGAQQWDWDVVFASKFPRLNPIEHLLDVLDKQVGSTEAPPRNLQDLKDLLLTCWCQIPQHAWSPRLNRSPLWTYNKHVYIYKRFVWVDD